MLVFCASARVKVYKYVYIILARSIEHYVTREQAKQRKPGRGGSRHGERLFAFPALLAILRWWPRLNIMKICEIHPSFAGKRWKALRGR